MKVQITACISVSIYVSFLQHYQELYICIKLYNLILKLMMTIEFIIGVNKFNICIPVALNEGGVT